jgi:TPR repeat protein
VALIYAEGQLVPADPQKAARYFGRACELGNMEGCANLAFEYFRTNLDGVGIDINRTLSTLEESGAVTNDGRVCHLIGYACETGRGLPMDKAKARQFYEQGARLGNLEAWKSLARMQLGAEGGPADHAAAAMWLQKAADARDGPSCLYLARLYHNGDGVQRDEQKANALLQEACDLGVKPACLLLQKQRK